MSWVWAHPRVCGEHGRLADATIRLVGSSPRLRGALVTPQEDGILIGLIPASAGSTAGWLMPRSGWWAHPRVCGEHGVGFDVAHAECGSSPRLRGAHLLTSTFGKGDGYVKLTVSRS